jgi:hypothetical protein
MTACTLMQHGFSKMGGRAGLNFTGKANDDRSVAAMLGNGHFITAPAG